ncbi:hypothetical protein TBLA_0B06990 [Henningerozyma blattae CBS 6284]|uniref:Protein ICE2 n=1 Tax=Henningerozyma blattae (strain ATCC 34711 / CBS 6284 / DSM 70876 / NBRC 10599 / NRRL Y-10934 / UCD 77-7) TaxID=1071380 RepID=I2GZG7_HENB6|nr:hypothetical protein TBLA_0B06990 [Tetrapisispora blattae CBS 6284]CCH59519.1 hypothetical protein TBLA_0B06990 [Tetrapisispora blattae CBS 6284]
MPWVVKSVKQSIRMLWGCFYLISVLITIPSAFKIGGLYCGLSFTMTLFHLYFLSTTMHLIAKRTLNNFYILLSTLVYYLQHIVIASLLYIFITIFSDGNLNEILSNNKTDQLPSLLYYIKNDTSKSVSQNFHYLLFYYYYYYAVQPWNYLLSHSTPFFTLLEGFFTILGIQAIGETYCWLLLKKQKKIFKLLTWLISVGVIFTAIHFLYKIYEFQVWELSIQTASLLGVTMSLVLTVGIFGIFSTNGSLIESSLFLGYIIRCFYEISPELSTSATTEILDNIKEAWQNHQGSITVTEHILFYYNNVLLKNINSSYLFNSNFSKSNDTSAKNRTLAEIQRSTNNYTLTDITKPSDLIHLIGFKSIYQNWLIYATPIYELLKDFVLNIPTSLANLSQVTYKLAYDSVSPSIVINLCFRVLIFYSATRIIPAVQRKNHLETKRSRNFLKAFYLFSPCIVIAMYTNLILQYSGELKNDLCIWGCDIISKSISQRMSTINMDVGSDDTYPNREFIVNSWGFWNWCNIFCTIFIYGCELMGL